MTTTLVETADESGMGLDSSAGQSPDDLAGTPWVPETLADVQKALEWLGEAETDLAEIERQYQAVLAVALARRQAIAHGPESRASWLRSILSLWAQSHRGEVVRGSGKTRQFMAGSVGFRAKSERLVVTDRAALVAWLESQPDASLYRSKVEPEMKALQARFKATGEIPVGCDFEPATETIAVVANPLPQLKE